MKVIVITQCEQQFPNKMKTIMSSIDSTYHVITEYFELSISTSLLSHIKTSVCLIYFEMTQLEFHPSSKYYDRLNKYYKSC
jgi:hypothetical protein